MQAVELARPEDLVAGQPGHRLLHGIGVQLAEDGAPGLGAGHQAGLGQHVQMLHDRRQRHGEGAREITDRQGVCLAETGEQRPPGRIGESLEGTIEGRGLLLNHIV